MPRRPRWPTTWTVSLAASRCKCGRRSLGQRLASWTRRQPALASRLAALGVFYIIELVNYYERRRWARTISRRISLWMAALGGAVGRLPAIPRKPAVVDPRQLRLGHARLAPAAGDAAGGQRRCQPTLVGYPLLIVASGLWFRVRFVLFITLLSLCSYGVLVIDFYRWRPELKPGSVRASTAMSSCRGIGGAGIGGGIPGAAGADVSSFCGRQLP